MLLCGVAKSTNGPLSKIVSEILQKVDHILENDIGTEIRRTENMVAGIEDVNQKKPKDLVVFSLDVFALYPNIKVIDVDIHQLGYYLLLFLGEEGAAEAGPFPCLLNQEDHRRYQVWYYHTGGDGWPGLQVQGRPF